MSKRQDMVGKEFGGTWKFAYRVVLPVVLAVGVTAAMVAGFVYWSTARSDDRSLQRETLLVKHVIAQQVMTLTGQQAYYTDWDDAITALQKGDGKWLDENLGGDLFDNDKFDRIYVLNSKVRAVYAMYGGGKTAASNFEADRSVIAPMVASLKVLDANGAMDAYNNGNADKVPRITDVTLVGGRVAYVGITPIVSSSGDILQDPGTENFLVAIRFLDAALDQDLMSEYMIASAAFATKPSTVPGIASFPVLDNSGQAVGWFTWQADKPGGQILVETLPSMLGALIIAAAVILVLLRGLGRSTAALEAGRARAEHQANHDVLTGLANRAFFNKRLEEALSGEPGDKTSIALLALDLDRFKQVNDTMGHEAGDQLLCEVGQRLTPLVATTDTVARLGGDEFAIIQRGVRDPAEVNALSDRIIAALGAPFVLSGRVAQIGVSIGIVITPASQAARDLASKADIALYEAKASGRNTYRFFVEGMTPAAVFRERVGAELEVAGLPVERSKVA